VKAKLNESFSAVQLYQSSEEDAANSEKEVQMKTRDVVFFIKYVFFFFPGAG